MKYENKKNGKLATLISEDPKFKTVLLQYEDGTTVTVSNPTLKRWWKKVLITDVEQVTEITDPADIDDTTYVEVVMKQKENLVLMPGSDKLAELKNEQQTNVEKELTDEQYAQIGKEIAQQAKQKAENVKREKSSVVVSYTETPLECAHNICKQFKQYELTTAKNNVGVHIDSKRVLDIWGRKSRVRIYVSSDNKAFKSLSKKLYVVEGAGSGKFDISMYVEQSKIEEVITHLLKEDK